MADCLPIGRGVDRIALSRFCCIALVAGHGGVHIQYLSASVRNPTIIQGGLMTTATATIPSRKAPVKVRQTKMLIDGKWVNSTSGKTFESINPSTGEVIANVAEGDAPDVDK